jgi:hypothetical protein
MRLESPGAGEWLFSGNGRRAFSLLGSRIFPVRALIFHACMEQGKRLQAIDIVVGFSPDLAKKSQK